MAAKDELEKIEKELKKESSETGASTNPGKAPGVSGEDSPGSEGSTSPKESRTTFGTKLGEMAARLNTKISEIQSGGQSTQQAAQQNTKAAPSASSGNPEDIKKHISDIVKKKVDSGISEMKENMKGLEKISNLESKINAIADRLNSQMFQPNPRAGPVAGGGTSIARELASFGEEVDFQTELYDLKKTIAGLAKTLDTLNKKMEYRVSILEDRAKTLDRIPDLEETLHDILQKLGPENVQKLRKLIFSSDEIVDEVIPGLVTKNIRAKLEPALNEIRDMQETILDFSSKLSHIKEEVLNLEKLRDDIQELRADKENIYKELGEDESRINEKLDMLRQNVRKKLDSVIDKFKFELNEIRKSQADSIKKEVKESFLHLNEPRFSDIEKRQMIIDERLKQMSKTDSELDKKISSTEAPENLRKWLETRTVRLERGIITDIKSLNKKNFTNSAEIARMADSLKSFQISMNDVPKRLENQGNMINKLLDTKDFFAGRAESLAAEMKGLSEKLSFQNAELAGLKQSIGVQEARFNDNINRQRDYLNAAKDDLSKHLNKEIISIRNTLERKNQDLTKTSLAEFKTEIKRLSGTEEELRSLRKSHETSTSRLQKMVAEIQSGLKNIYPELKLADERLDELDSAYKELSKNLSEAYAFHKTSDSVLKTELTKYIDSSMKSLVREVEARRQLDAKAAMDEFRQEVSRLEGLGQELAAFKSASEKRMDELSQALTGLSGPLTDLKVLTKRMDELEDISMATDKRLDVGEDKATGHINALNNRLNLIEKALNDIRLSHEALEKRVGQDNEQLQRALGEVSSERSALKKEILAQRARVGELIKELKST